MKVFHPDFGPGKVLGTRWYGMELLVKFDSGLTMWIKRNELKFESEQPEVSEVRPKSRIRVQTSKTGDFEARRMIEAFKLGIVPRFAVKNFTFGREKEIEIIEQTFKSFEKDKGATLLIEGAYGTGKTHLVDYIASVAVDRGFAVARTEVHPLTGMPTKPKRIYRELCESLYYQEQGKIKGLLDLLMESKDTKLDPPHPFLTPLFRLLKKEQDIDLLFDWIKGESMDREFLDFAHKWQLPVLLDHSSANDIYINLLSAFSFLLSLKGIKGLLLLLDEGEGVFFARKYFYSRWITAYLFLKGLILASHNLKELTEIDNLRDFYPVGKLDELGLLHSGVRPIPYLYKLPSRFFVVITFTPLNDSYFQTLKELVPLNNQIYLENPDSSVFNEIFKKTLELYKKAFPEFKITEKQAENLRQKLLRDKNHSSIRIYLELLINELDILRHYSNHLNKPKK